MRRALTRLLRAQRRRHWPPLLRLSSAGVTGVRAVKSDSSSWQRRRGCEATNTALLCPCGKRSVLQCLVARLKSPFAMQLLLSRRRTRLAGLRPLNGPWWSRTLLSQRQQQYQQRR
jgi:hypothetical protein